MRNKIDYGIDLGTTNSAIARMENGVPTIKKSETLKDTIPSCVHFNKRQDILVGDTAFNVMKNDNTRALKTFESGKTNTFIEFKRTMGTTHNYECSNMSKNLTPEELSAEVLKKLKSFIQDENLYSIVITVPAKFLNPQNEATMKAAKLAGFKHVQLLQEPVAAATAYGLTAKNKDSYWCVFDFGGGTFDAALVKSEEGILSVKDTDGDNWLGGKNLDEAIVDEIIIPNLQKSYSIDSIIADTYKRQILREAIKPFAEEIKIEMSFKDKINYISPLGSLPFEDENGEEPEIEVDLSESELERVLGPIFQKAIDITKGLLKRNNLKGSDLGALILVGGPTFSPILRRMLKEQITESVDTSVDPMTVVAKGAALFASTISVSDEVKEETRDKTKLQLDLKYEATSADIDEMLNLKVLKDKTTGKHIGLWYFDAYARKGKRSGAWMNAYRNQQRMDGSITTIVSNNSNFIQGKPGEPVLISWDDATTLFHEFGHALHGLSSNVTYPSLSGTNVVRDYVEFPSQLLEHWLSTPEVLNKFALHYKTGTPMPKSLVDRIEKASTFNEGFSTTEFLSSALVDMKLHTSDQDNIDPDKFEKETLKALNMPSEIVMRHRTPQFAHIFSSDAYSAGYYSYLWADVITADAFSAFTEAGGPYDKKVAASLSKNIFSVGNTIDPEIGFRNFRGRNAETKALMKERGFPVK